jgi:hypothetical protein
MEVKQMKGYNWKQAKNLCNLLEKNIVSIASQKTVMDYLDFKETMYVRAPLYGCEGECDKALFMYALCIDYLQGLDFNNSLGKETLINELYEVGRV